MTVSELEVRSARFFHFPHVLRGRNGYCHACAESVSHRSAHVRRKRTADREIFHAVKNGVSLK